MYKVPDDRHERWEWGESRPPRTNLMLIELVLWVVVFVASLAYWGREDVGNWPAIGIVMAIIAFRVRMMIKSAS